MLRRLRRCLGRCPLGLGLRSASPRFLPPLRIHTAESIEGVSLPETFEATGQSGREGRIPFSAGNPVDSRSSILSPSQNRPV